MPEAPHTETVEHLIQRLASLCMHVMGFKDKLLDDGEHNLEYRRHLARVEDDIFNALAHLRSLHGSIRKAQNTYRGKRHD
jgi:hypothetical protein